MAMTRTQFPERLRLAWSRSPLPAFLRWWGGELAALLPARARGRLLRGPDVLALNVASDAVRVQRRRTGDALATIATDLPLDVQRAAFVSACAGIDPDDRRLVLVLEHAAVLQRRLVLPAAAASDPRRVVGYELDRQTPFKPAELYYAVRIAAARVPAGQVALDLYAVPRSALDPALERLAALGAQPDAVDVRTDGGAVAGIDLLPSGRRPRRVDRRRRVNAALAVACAVLVVLVLGQWLGNRRTALATMQQQVDAMRAQAAQSAHLHAQLVQAEAASKFLVRRRADGVSPLALLDELTRRMPADASLEALTLDDSGGLDISGEADHAAALVDILGGSGLLADPKLQGVIQPDPATGKERFELVAKVRAPESARAH